MTDKNNSLQAAIDRASKAEPEAAPAPDSNRHRAKTKTREGTRLIAGHFPADYAIQIRTIAAMEDRTIQSLLNEALEDLFTKKAMKIKRG